MKVQVEGDIITALISGTAPGIDLPEHLAEVPIDRLRHNGRELVDASLYRKFWVDPDGTKHIVPGDGWAEIESAWNDKVVSTGEGWRVVARDEVLRDELLAEAGAQRRKRDAAGIIVGDIVVPTDEATRNVLIAAYIRAKASKTYTVQNWKVGAGRYVELSNAQIVQIGEAVMAHIQSGFDLNAKIDTDIAAGRIKTRDEIAGIFAAG